MTTKRPTTIDEYIAAAPAEGRPHLERLYELLQEVAPEAEQTIKWSTPFFVEPRFLFAFSAHKHHLNFTPDAGALAAFDEELEGHETTQGSLKVRYDQPLPEELITQLAEYRVRVVSERDDDSFW